MERLRTTVPARIRRLEHASFPEAATTIDEEEIEIPGGPLRMLALHRHRSDGTSRFWFARDLPGLAVNLETRDADGVFRMTMLENVPGATLHG